MSLFVIKFMRIIVYFNNSELIAKKGFKKNCLQMAVKNTKICLKYDSNFTKKIGEQNAIQRYQYNACNKKFSPKKES